MESLSNVDSAGSCDSVISTNSVWSQDSMEHLSAEEKACLMYLEETIEALEVQEDSGLSNDEPDVLSRAEPHNQLRRNGSHKISTPTTHPATDPLLTGLTRARESQRYTTPQTASSSVVDMKDPEKKDLRVETDTIVSDGATGYTSSSEKTTEGSKLNSSEASELDLEIIPPPTDFMDESDLAVPPETMTVLPPPANGSLEQKTTLDLQQMHQRSSLRKPVTFSATEDSPSKHSEVPLTPLMSPPADFPEPRSPPAVAPKPTKLPTNILLKSQKSPTSQSHGNPGHVMPAQSDRMILDPQKTRIEALRKLGLLKDNEEKSSPVVSPNLPLKSAANRGSQSHSPPVSPGAPHSPPRTPSLTPVNNPPPALTAQTSPAPVVLPSASSASPPIQDAEILPAPAAFCDPTGPVDNQLSADTETSFSTSSNTPSVPLNQLTPPKVIGMKSATLERSGLGLSSQMSAQNLSMRASDEKDSKHLRNTRPRPASLGSGKDFSHAKGDGLVASGSPHSQKPQSTQASHQRQSSKLPRSQGISVLICPRSENEDDRREALKKLGLLRD
ncbi:specifically androgen-regulated gene protein isoform X2 [Cyprinodon tularosa]|nr:specifically androgen-regulated gene protein isoform X2 [Cyprinodon tularosa]